MSRKARTASRVVIGAMALVLASANGFLLVARNDATAISLEETLDSFRAAPSAGAERTERPRARAREERAGGKAARVRPATPVAPAPGERGSDDAFTGPRAGVYAYATRGYEEISFAGSRREYPSETYATIRDLPGCAWQVEYRLIAEHVDTVDYCSERGTQTITGNRSEVEFFGKRDSVSAACEPPVLLAATEAEPGSTSRSVCRSEDGSTQRHHVTFVGMRAIEVGGRTIRAFHVVDRVTLTGKADGTAQARVWFHPTTGMVLRLHRSADTDGHSSFGTVHYTEDVDMRLLSLRPQR